MKNAYFCGFNGFLQFPAHDAKKTATPTELCSEWSGSGSKYAFSFVFNAFTNGRSVVLSGLLDGIPGSQKVLAVDDDIKKLAASDKFCLVLLENGELYRINVRKCVLERMNFTGVERPHKRSIFGEVKDQEESSDPVENVACGTHICIAITRTNVVYNIPSRIYEFPKHVRIKSLVCGFEHALALTRNGDVYAWGNGMRGQLGRTELKTEETPVLVEALAGIKIIAISAGGWSSAAISSFGDLYVWGSNVNGQLGITVYKTISTDSKVISKRKNPTVYHLPQIVDISPCCPDRNDENACSFLEVMCGARHTFVKKACGKIFCCGWNEYGQLGLNSTDAFKDNFTEFKTPFPGDCNIHCGRWCTVFLPL